MEVREGTKSRSSLWFSSPTPRHRSTPSTSQHARCPVWAHRSVRALACACAIACEAGGGAVCARIQAVQNMLLHQQNPQHLQISKNIFEHSSDIWLSKNLKKAHSHVFLYQIVKPINTSQGKFNLHFSIPSMSPPSMLNLQKILPSTLYIYFEKKDNGNSRLQEMLKVRSPCSQLGRNCNV